MTELTAVEQRVIGCLLEKERTVPDTYPMTLNGLVGACNQSSNRWPVADLEPRTVQGALDSLKEKRLVRFVHPSHGERTTKYRQVLDDAMRLEPEDAAVLCVLLLRGPQTIGELRTRTERLHPFESPGEVEATLDRLAAREEPLVVPLPRQAGQKEGRWAHLLGDSPPATPEPPPPMPEPAMDLRQIRRESVASSAGEELEARIAALEAQVARLYELLGESPTESAPS